MGIICRIVVYSLTAFYRTKKGDFGTRLKENLRMINLDERPVGFYTSNLMKNMKSWEDLFDANGNPRIKYEGNDSVMTGKDAEQLFIPFDLTNFDK